MGLVVTSMMVMLDTMIMVAVIGRVVFTSTVRSYTTDEMPMTVV